DWSSDVCSSDLVDLPGPILECFEQVQLGHERADVAHAASSTFARAAAGASGSSGGGDHAAIAPRRGRPTRRGGGSPWRRAAPPSGPTRSEEHTSELQSRENLVCRLLLEKKKHILFYDDATQTTST